MKNDTIIHRTNVTIFFMSEYAYRHLWHEHDGPSLFGYVDRLEGIFAECCGSCSQGLLDAFIEYAAMSTYTESVKRILYDLQNFMCTSWNFGEYKDIFEVFSAVYDMTRAATDNAVRLSNEHGVYLTRIKHILVRNLDPRWNESNYADILEYPFFGALVSNKLSEEDVKPDALDSSKPDDSGVTIFTVGESCVSFPVPKCKPELSSEFSQYYRKVGFFIDPFHASHDFNRIYEIIKFVSSLYYFAKAEDKRSVSCEVINDCFSVFYKENIHKVKIGIDKRINGLRMWDFVNLHNKKEKYAINEIARSYCINKIKKEKENCEGVCPTVDCYSSLLRDLDVAISSINKCTICTTKNKVRRRSTEATDSATDGLETRTDIERKPDEPRLDVY